MEPQFVCANKYCLYFKFDDSVNGIPYVKTNNGFSLPLFQVYFHMRQQADIQEVEKSYFSTEEKANEFINFLATQKELTKEQFYIYKYKDEIYGIDFMPLKVESLRLYKGWISTHFLYSYFQHIINSNEVSKLLFTNNINNWVYYTKKNAEKKLKVLDSWMLAMELLEDKNAIRN